jgi:hypothetical protein
MSACFVAFASAADAFKARFGDPRFPPQEGER